MATGHISWEPTYRALMSAPMPVYRGRRTLAHNTSPASSGQIRQRAKPTLWPMKAYTSQPIGARLGQRKQAQLMPMPMAHTRLTAMSTHGQRELTLPKITVVRLNIYGSERLRKE